MTAAIGWIDFSPTARNRIRGFLDMIGQSGVVDELGIGTIRDSMSDMLFPGLSTLYTRSKYFFITPYILQDMVKDRKSIKDGRRFFEDEEIAANQAIIDFYKEHDKLSNEGYFGKMSGARLQRQPSAIYWSGIHHYKLVNTDESLDQMLIDKHSWVDELLMQSADSSNHETFEEGENFEKRKINVEYDSDWMKSLHTQGARLTRMEAETLQDRIMQIEPNSLLALLLADNDVWKVYCDANGKAGEPTNTFTDFAYKVVKGGMIDNKTLLRNIIRANDLSIFLYGQHAVYNIALYLRHGDDDYAEDFRAKSKSWYTHFRELMLAPDSFDISTYFLDANVRAFTRAFLQAQQSLVFSNKAWEDIEKPFVALVERQERNNKKRKSRFYKMDREESVNELREGSWLGLRSIEYRYGAGKSIIKDIRESL